MAERPIRVLLVDDEPDIRFSIRSFLAHDDRFEVVGEAADGEEALKRCAEGDVDVCLLDLRMPGLGGLETIPLMRAQFPHVEIAVFSAYGDQEHRLQAERGGAAAFIEKGSPPDFIAGQMASIAP
jgi:DNA-binding NarL/FixJ family response regulator